MASRSHWLTDAMTFSTSRPAADPVSRLSATDTSDTPRRWNRSSNSPRSRTDEPVEFRHDHHRHLTAVHQIEQSRETGPVQILGGHARVGDHVEQRRVVNR